MSSYKEILMSLEDVPEYNGNQFTSNTTPLQNFNQINQKVVKARGLTYSRLNEIIYLTVEDNIVQVISINTQLGNLNPNISREPLVERYQFKLPSLILDSITITEIKNAANSYLITIFTNNGHIQSFLKESNSNFKVLRGNYQDELNIVSVEYIYTINSDDFYSFGSSTGKIYIVSLTNDNDRLVLTHRQTISISTSNRLFKVFQDPIENGINSMKYLGNSLLCFIDTKFMFTIYNIKTKSVIYSNTLILNSKEELMSSKIIFNIVDLSKQEIELFRTKIFNVLFYLEYSNTYEIVSLELWFKNVPEVSLNQHYPTTITTTSPEELFDRIELGNEVSIKNKRVYVLKGQLVDMDIQDNKLWLIVEKRRTTMNHIQEIKFEDKYSISIISLKQDETNVNEDNNEIEWNRDNILDYQEKSLKNIINILEQVNSNCYMTIKEKNEICLSLITNEEYFQKEKLIKVFNILFKQNFRNKTEVVNMLRQQTNSISIDEELIIPLIQEELKCDEIVSMGWFNNKDLSSLCFIRKKCIGFIQPISFFERIDQEISQHESYIRNIIFNHNSELNNIKRSIEAKIEEYALIQCKYNQSNALYIIFAFIRIYLTEINLLIINEDYLSDFFNQNPNMSIVSFIEKVFDDNISIQSNNLGFLDFIHLIIKDLLDNNMDIIIDEINDIIVKYTEIKEGAEDALKKIALSSSMMDDDRNYRRWNEKYCEIISRIASNKIASMFHVSRDLISLTSWERVYSEYSEIDNDDNDILRKINEEAIRLLFKETFSSYLFSNHIASLSSSNSTNSINTYNKEMTFLEQTVLDNISKYKVPFLKEKDNRYIDILINSLLPDMQFQEVPKNALYQKLYRNRDFKMISLLNHIHNDPNSIQLVFLDIICQARQKNPSDMDSIYQSLNRYYSKLLEMTNIANGHNFFKQLEDLYFSLNDESYISNPSGINYNMQSNFNGSILMKGFKYVEKQLMSILNKDEMNQFYLHSFNWIYPNFQYRSRLQNGEINNEERDDSKVIYEDFIINFMKSAIQDDIRYALSCYNTFKENKNLDTVIKEMTEFFANYLINTFQFKNRNEFVQISISSNNELLEKICLFLEEKCSMNNTQLISLLNANLNDPKTSSNKQSSSLNFFNLLFSIYSQMKDYELACLISYKYAKVLDNAIKTDNFSPEMMIGLYQEKITALNNAILMMKKCTDSNQCFLYDNTPSGLNPINLDDLIKEKKYSEVKVVLLKKYEMSKELKEAINEEMISKIKKDNCLLNLIFQLRMYDLIIGMNMISFVNETQGKIMIYNLISNLLQGSSGNNDNENNKHDVDYEGIKVFIDQIKKSQCDEFAYQALEALLYFNSEYQVNELAVS